MDKGGNVHAPIGKVSFGPDQLATNLAALAYFVPAGYWLGVTAAVMALCNVIGAWLGSRMALKHGNRFVRRLFLVVVGALILRFAYDTFVRS